MVFSTYTIYHHATHHHNTPVQTTTDDDDLVSPASRFFGWETLARFLRAIGMFAHLFVTFADVCSQLLLANKTHTSSEASPGLLFLIHTSDQWCPDMETWNRWTPHSKGGLLAGRYVAAAILARKWICTRCGQSADWSDLIGCANILGQAHKNLA